MKTLYESIFDADFEPTVSNTIPLDGFKKCTGSKKVVLDKNLGYRLCVYEPVSTLSESFFEELDRWNINKFRIVGDASMKELSRLIWAESILDKDMEFIDTAVRFESINSRRHCKLKNCRVYCDSLYYLAGSHLENTQIECDTLYLLEPGYATRYHIDARSKIKANNVLFEVFGGPRKLKIKLDAALNIRYHDLYSDVPTVTVDTDPLDFFGLRGHLMDVPPFIIGNKHGGRVVQEFRNDESSDKSLKKYKITSGCSYKYLYNNEV